MNVLTMVKMIFTLTVLRKEKKNINLLFQISFSFPGKRTLREYFKTHLKEKGEPLNPSPSTEVGKCEKMSTFEGNKGECEMVFSNEIDKKLDTLFAHDSEMNPFADESDTSRMVKLIDGLRIVDPAVGTGAFPMGILHKLVFILSKLDPDNKRWKEAQIKAVSRRRRD